MIGAKPTLRTVKKSGTPMPPSIPRGFSKRSVTSTREHRIPPDTVAGLVQVLIENARDRSSETLVPVETRPASRTSAAIDRVFRKVLRFRWLCATNSAINAQVQKLSLLLVDRGDLDRGGAAGREMGRASRSPRR
jgi:hypothetical protein